MNEAALRRKKKDAFAAHLLSLDNRVEVETALTVEFMMANPDRDHHEAYEQAMDVWEHMFKFTPTIGPVRGQIAAPHALVRFRTPEGGEIKMRVEICQRFVRLRSTRGIATQRKIVEEELKNCNHPAKFLKKLATRHRKGRELAGTIQG